MKNISWKQVLKLVLGFGVLLVLVMIFWNNKVKWNHETPTYSVAFTKDNSITTYTSNTQKAASKIYEAGSIGKSVTAYVCLKLVEEGKLSLDDKIYPYLEEKMKTSDERMQKITVRQLLSHTAGFSPNFELGVDRKIYFEPGSSYCYSGVGYIYLQHVLESVTGKSLEALAQEYVFQPLDMKDSTFETVSTETSYVRSASIALYVVLPSMLVMLILLGVGTFLGHLTKYRFFSRRNLIVCCFLIGILIDFVLIILVAQKLMLYPILLGFVGSLIFACNEGRKRYVVFSSSLLLIVVLGFLLPVTLPAGKSLYRKEPNAAYSFCTTSEDLIRFSRQLLMDCEKEPYREMFCSQVEINADNGFGFGLAIEKDGDQITYWHSGINIGMQSLMVLQPETHSAVVILTNSDHGLKTAKKIAREKLNVDGTWDIIRNK